MIASASSLAPTLGRGTRLVMASRPETEITAALLLIPALSTASLTASATMPGSRTVPSAMTSRGSGTRAKASRESPPLVSTSSTTLTALAPMSKPNVACFFPSPNSPIVGSLPDRACDLRGSRGGASIRG